VPPQVTTWWDRVSAVAPAPDLALVLVTGLLAFAATSAPGTWRHTRHLVTIAHEGAHGVAALASGRRLAGIRLHSDTSGLTVSVGRDRGFGMVVTSAAGYVGPALVGLLAALLLAHGHAVGVLWALLVLLALLLLQIRNFFGLWAVLLAGTGLVVVTRWTPAEVQLVIAYVVTWFLLLGAPRAVVELQRERRRRRGRERTSDAAALARLTRLPAVVWVGFFLLVTVGCLLLGGRMLLVVAR
jgi:Peptidase M50B-like